MKHFNKISNSEDFNKMLNGAFSKTSIGKRAKSTQSIEKRLNIRNFSQASGYRI